MISFSFPYIDEDVVEEVVKTLRSGWISTGAKTREFEHELEKYCGSRKVLCVNSAAAGLELILRWYGVKEGDEVIIPAYTYVATANVVVHCGAKPVMVDSGDGFNIDPEKVKKAITPRTKVIIPVDMGGFPADYDQINSTVQADEIRQKFKAESPEQEQMGRILILSDSAHSLGASYKGKRTGSVADVSVFSFHAVKNITTAEGGAISFQLPLSFDIAAIYNMLRILTLHGQDRDALIKLQSGNWRYDTPYAGYKMNMPDLLAAIGVAQFKKYESVILPKRKHIFDTYSAALEKYDWAIVPEYSTGSRETSYHMYLLRIKGISEEVRDDIIKTIYTSDIAVNVHFLPLPMMSYYKNMGFDIKDFPESYRLYSSEISLPVHPALSDDDLSAVVKAVVSAVEKHA